MTLRLKSLLRQTLQDVGEKFKSTRMNANDVNYGFVGVERDERYSDNCRMSMREVFGADCS